MLLWKVVHSAARLCVLVERPSGGPADVTLPSEAGVGRYSRHSSTPLACSFALFACGI